MNALIEATNSLLRYFDLFSRYRQAPPESYAGRGKRKPTIGWQLCLFASLTLGILAKGLLEFLTGKALMWIPSWSRVILSIVAAIGAFPAAYKAAMDEKGPGLVQLCVTFALGVGVKTLADLPQ